MLSHFGYPGFNRGWTQYLIFDKGGKNIQWRKDNLFNKWCWKTGQPPVIIRLKTRSRGLSPNPENNGELLTPGNINRQELIKCLHDPPPRILEIKAKINKWDLIKIKSFCITKDTISKVKRQPSEWEKIIASEATDKQLISKIYKQLMQLNSRKINHPIKKWAKELNRHFSKEDITEG